MVKERMPPLACLAELPSAAEIAAREVKEGVGRVKARAHGEALPVPPAQWPVRADAHDLPLAHALLEAALKEPKGRTARSILKRAS